MFKLTAKLKEYAVKNLGVKADATDAVYQKAINSALASGKLNYKQFAALGAVTPVPVKRTPVKTVTRPVMTKTVTRPVPFNPVALDKAVENRVQKELAKMNQVVDKDAFNPERMLYKSNPTVKARVKSAVEQFSSKKSAAVYPDRCGINGRGTKHGFAGQQVRFMGRNVDMPSDLDKGVIAAYFKFMCEPQLQAAGIPIPRWLKMTDTDKQLLNHAFYEVAWTGVIGRSKGQRYEWDRKKLDDLQVKTILNDATSGGAEISPYMFDDAVVLYPLLYGELFPHVNVVNTDRASIKSGAISNPTMSSGTAEGTAITPITTTGFITAFDTTIWPNVGAIKLGLDFEEDSPVDVGGILVNQFGLVALKELDRFIAAGNGTNEPLGLFSTVGAIVANSDNGAAGPMTFSDLESLRFGINKEYRTEPQAFEAFVSSDLMFRNVKGISVGPLDERRPLGLDYHNYEVEGTPWKIQNSIAAGRAAFVMLNRYRMYRRLGLQVRVETAGSTLALANEKLIVVRQRYGGKMETGNAVCIMTDGQI